MKIRAVASAGPTAVLLPALLWPTLFPRNVAAAVAVGADLALGKSASTNTAQLGDFVSFVVGVTKVGFSTVSNIVVNETLPPGLAYSSSTAPTDENRTNKP